MPEIKLGSSKNMKNINLGSKEIEEVRLGNVLVWQNNLVPQIVLTTPNVGAYGDLDFPIGITVSTNVNIVFSVQDLDPLDTVISYSVSGPPGFTDIPTTPISPPTNPVTGLTFTIPNTLFPTSGNPTTNNVFTVRVTDQRNKFGEYTITVIGVSVPPPTVTVTQGFGSHNSFGTVGKVAYWAITQPQTTIDNGYNPQYSFDNINWINLSSTPSTATPSIVSASTSASCGDSSTVIVYCRSVKTGETTAVGNSASSTLSVSAGNARFPLSTPIGCKYQDYGASGTGAGYKRFEVPISCDGKISSADSMQSATWYIRPLTTYFRYTGTTPPSGTINSVGTSYSNYANHTLSFSGTYKVPQVSGTEIQIGCSGGDYRMTNVSFYSSGVPRIAGGFTLRLNYNDPPGGTQSSTAGLTNPGGPDWTFTTYSASTSIVSANLIPGTTSVSLTITGAGNTTLNQTVVGYWQMLDGSKKTASGNPSSGNYTQIFLNGVFQP